MTDFKYKDLLTEEYLRKLYSENGSALQISKILGIPTKTIIVYLDKYFINRSKLNRYDIDSSFFTKNTEATYYVAGFIAADGTLSSMEKRYSIEIALKAKDINQLEKIKTLVKSTAPITKYNIKLENNLHGVCRFVMNSKKMYNDLLRFNIVPSKTLTYKFPILDNNLVQHFMRGYFDGDGSWSKNANLDRISFRLLGTKDFLEEYLKILQNNVSGIIDNKVIYKSNHSNVFCLDFGGNPISGRIADFLYKDATIFLDRKYDRIKNLLK